jgi:hypothetical protein
MRRTRRLAEQRAGERGQSLSSEGNLPEGLKSKDRISPAGRAISRRATPLKRLILLVLLLSCCIFRLEKTDEIRYSKWCRRFAVRFPPNRPALSNQSTSAKCTRPENLALRQEPFALPAWSEPWGFRSPGPMKSSPRLAARDGMEQEPYEFRSLAIGIKG